MPMYADVSFDRSMMPSSFQNIVNVLSQYGLWSSMITYFNQNNQKQKTMSFNLDAKSGVPFAPDNFFSGVGEPEELNVMNFVDFFNDAPDFLSSMSQVDYKNFVAGKGNSLDYTYIEGFNERVVTTMLTTAARDNFVAIAEQQARAFEEVLSGSSAQKAVLYYKVEKWEVDANDNPVLNIQNFFLPNTGNEDFLRLFDTQIKYGNRIVTGKQKF